MKAQILGFEISEGVSKKTGNAYSIGKLYAALPIVGKGSRGMMGSTYQCEPAVLRKLENLPMPCEAELEMQDVMRFGERRQEIASISPVGMPKTGAAAAAARTAA